MSDAATTAAMPVARQVSGGRWLGRNHLRLGGLWLVMLAFPFVVPNDYIVNLGVFFFINLILIGSLNLLMGYCGQISLCHGAFFGLGAYASGVLAAKFGISPWFGLVASLTLTAAVAMIVGMAALRLHGHYLAMATLGTNAILSVMFNELTWLTGGPNGLIGVPWLEIGPIALWDDTSFFFFAWAVALIVMVVILNVVESRVGRGLRALAGSEIAASSLGVDTFRYKLAVFVLTAAMAGLAGFLYVHFITFSSPETFNFFASVLLVVMVALGGWGKYWGPVFGALVMTAVPELLRALEDLELLLFGLSMILVLLFFPSGIAGALEDLVGRLRRLPAGTEAGR